MSSRTDSTWPVVRAYASERRSEEIKRRLRSHPKDTGMKIAEAKEAGIRDDAHDTASAGKDAAAHIQEIHVEVHGHLDRATQSMQFAHDGPGVVRQASKGLGQSGAENAPSSHLQQLPSNPTASSSSRGKQTPNKSTPSRHTPNHRDRLFTARLRSPSPTPAAAATSADAGPADPQRQLSVADADASKLPQPSSSRSASQPLPPPPADIPTKPDTADLSLMAAGTALWSAARGRVEEAAAGQQVANPAAPEPALLQSEAAQHGIPTSYTQQAQLTPMRQASPQRGPPSTPSSASKYTLRRPPVNTAGYTSPGSSRPGSMYLTKGMPPLGASPSSTTARTATATRNPADIGAAEASTLLLQREQEAGSVTVNNSVTSAVNSGSGSGTDSGTKQRQISVSAGGAAPAVAPRASSASGIAASTVGSSTSGPAARYGRRTTSDAPRPVVFRMAGASEALMSRTVWSPAPELAPKVHATMVAHSLAMQLVDMAFAKATSSSSSAAGGSAGGGSSTAAAVSKRTARGARARPAVAAAAFLGGASDCGGPGGRTGPAARFGAESSSKQHPACCTIM